MPSAAVNISVTLTFDLTTVDYLPNGDRVLTFTCRDPQGNIKKIKAYNVRADGSGIYDLDNNSQLAASSASFITDLNGFKTNCDTGMASAASQGKVIF